MKLQGHILTVEQLNQDDHLAMLDLMDRHYEHVDTRVFADDLAEKQLVLKLVDPDTGRLAGFSTQKLIPIDVDGQRRLILFSGDTIVDEAAWGRPDFFNASAALVSRLIEAHPNEDLYWYLISKGHRTYRFLPVFFREFFPRARVPTPPLIKNILHGLGKSRFPELYEPETGIIRADQHAYWLRENLVPIGESRLRDRHVRFFLERNPGYVHGDELCCLAPLRLDNFTAVARRFIQQEQKGSRDARTFVQPGVDLELQGRSTAV
jgi:hypothetical protein|tara:strand:+ start:2023 stop:2814 length:792 start_codon:yes stop_codon:yes gene_type:complete